VRCDARICVNTSSAFFKSPSTFFNASSIFSGLTRFLPLKTFTISSKASRRGLSTAKKSSAWRVLFSTNNRALTANFMMFFSKSSAFFWEFDSAFTMCFRAVSSAVVSSLSPSAVTFSQSSLLQTCVRTFGNRTCRGQSRRGSHRRCHRSRHRKTRVLEALPSRGWKPFPCSARQIPSWPRWRHHHHQDELSWQGDYDRHLQTGMGYETWRTRSA